MFVGSFNEGATVTYRVVWTPDPDSSPITDATVTFTQGATVVSQSADPAGPNTFKATVVLPKPGNWHIKWETVPPGGVAEGRVYIEVV